MRFLLDENLSPRVVRELLTTAGHDTIHVRDVGLDRAPDELVLAAARDQRRIVITADADFGALLSRTGGPARP